MDSFTPGLRESVLALTVTLRGIVFCICLAGFMVQVHRARHDLESLTEPFIRAVVVIGLVAALPQCFGATERLMLGIADVVREKYTEHPMEAAARLRATVEDSDSGFSLRRVGESLYKATLWAGAKLLVLLASLLQLPFLLLQHILKLLCYLFLPVALALFMVPSLSSLGVRYLQQTLAVLAWPIGFAVTELVAFYLLAGYQNNVAIAFGLTPGQLDKSSLASLLGGLVGALWLIVGTVGTPVVMQMLFCSGTPLSGGGQSTLQQVFSIQQMIGAMASIKAVGLSSGIMAAKSHAGAALPPTLPPPATPPMAHSSANSPKEPAGNHGHGAAAAPTQLPRPHTTM